MSAPVRLAAFAAVLVLVFGGAALAGAAIDPTEWERPAMPQHGGNESGHEIAEDAPGSAEPSHEGPEAVGGLAVSESGYTLTPDRTFFEPGEPASFSFVISDDRGRPVHNEFELEHEREMHLIVVRRDTAVYEHLHPRRDEDGTWSVPISLPNPGVYRAYADFKTDGTRRTLATDLFVTGDFRPEPLPAPTSNQTDGNYRVDLSAGSVVAGSESELPFAVSAGGRPVRDLEDYLGAKGHLVALREGDLAYLHVHPIPSTGRVSAVGDADEESHSDEHSGGSETDANKISFAATFPSDARYRLFLQFKSEGVVHTVAFTLEVAR
ncbi:MAG: hypothetical protein M3454_18285 [Actinomycetota bacterium]|nr:hypothetical protein [Actinomycetota bacterium]